MFWKRRPEGLLVSEREGVMTVAIREGHRAHMEIRKTEEGWNVLFRGREVAILPDKKRARRFAEEWLSCLSVSKADLEKTLTRGGRRKGIGFSLFRR